MKQFNKLRKTRNLLRRLKNMLKMKGMGMAKTFEKSMVASSRQALLNTQAAQIEPKKISSIIHITFLTVIVCW